MKELDELLSRFARERFAAAAPEMQTAFEALLTLPDPQIADYLLGHGAPPEPGLAAVVEAVLSR